MVKSPYQHTNLVSWLRIISISALIHRTMLLFSDEQNLLLSSSILFQVMFIIYGVKEYHKKSLRTFDTSFHIFLMQVFLKYARNWNSNLAFWPGSSCGLKKPFWNFKSLLMYSCNNITTTLIQISRLFYFGFFSKTKHQMMI